MLKRFFNSLANSWADWVGDRHLQLAIHRELRRGGFAVHAAAIRDVRLIAIERPGWVQVRSFSVETFDTQKAPVTLMGLSRDDGRQAHIDVLLTDVEAEFNARREQWSEGLIRRR